jgi:hypothetical protein
MLVFELAIRFFAAAGLLTIPGPPPRTSEIWDADHETFGVWHSLHSSEVVQTRDFAVTYETNSVGARDVERQRDQATKRVVVLGDSVVEGWGVESRKRLSNRLEASTAIPHLNFGMAHFGPYQSYLVYRDLAKTFAHDIVMLGVFPYNDFLDLDFEAAAHALGYEYRYRPYLIGEYPDYRHFDHREATWQNFLRRRFYTYSAIDFVIDRLTDHTVDGYKSQLYNDRDLYFSYFYDYSEDQLQLLKHSLELLQAEATGKTMVVVLFPALPDFARLQQSGPSPLADEIRSVDQAGTLRVVDLLSEMARSGADHSKYFVSPEHSDFHLNPKGNRVAAEILRSELADLYH